MASLGKDALAISLDSLHWWLHVWTALVVGGLVVEYLPTFIKALKSELVKHGTEMIGGILITCGVAGELYVEVRSARVEGKLRAIEQLEVASLQHTTELLRRENLEIEQGVAWRRMPEPQRRLLASHLATFVGQPASIWFHAGDHEGVVFASEIANALQLAGWKVFKPASLLDFAAAGQIGNPSDSIPPTGITVEHTGDRPTLGAATMLAVELTNLGFDAITAPASKRDSSSTVVRIVVEDRPEGPQGEAKLRKEKK